MIALGVVPAAAGDNQTTILITDSKSAQYIDFENLLPHPDGFRRHRAMRSILPMTEKPSFRRSRRILMRPVPRERNQNCSATPTPRPMVVEIAAR